MGNKAEKYKEVKNWWGDPEKAKVREGKLQAQIKHGLPPLFRRVCRLCGVRLGFGETNDGKTIAFDLEARVYTPVFERTDSHDVIIVRTELAFVAHDEVCKVLNGEKERIGDI